MKIIVDRIVGDTATVELESGEMVNIPAVLLKGAKEGDKITLTVEPDTIDEFDSESDNDTHSIFERLRKKRDIDNN